MDELKFYVLSTIFQSQQDNESNDERLLAMNPLLRIGRFSPSPEGIKTLDASAKPAEILGFWCFGYRTTLGT